MTALNLSPNLAGHDDLYDALIHLHEGLGDEESLRLWARLTLILMNHIGDREVLLAAFATAKRN